MRVNFDVIHWTPSHSLDMNGGAFIFVHLTMGFYCKGEKFTCHHVSSSAPPASCVRINDGKHFEAHLLESEGGRGIPLSRPGRQQLNWSIDFRTFDSLSLCVSGWEWPLSTVSPHLILPPPVSVPWMNCAPILSECTVSANYLRWMTGSQGLFIHTLCVMDQRLSPVKTEAFCLARNDRGFLSLLWAWQESIDTHKQASRG